MNIKQNKVGRLPLSRKTAVVLVASFLILVCLYVAVSAAMGWFPFKNKPDSTSGNNPPSTEQIKAGNVVKQASTQGSKTSGSDQPAAPVVQSDGRQLVQVDITGVNKLDSVTRVGVLISYLDQSGTCTLTVTSASGSVLYTASAGVQALSNSSTCKGFSIPNSNLPDASYSLVVDYNSNKVYGSARYVQP